MMSMTGKIIVSASFVILGMSLSGCATMGASTTESAHAEEPASVEASVLAGDRAARAGDYEAALTSYLLAIDSQETPDPEIWFRVGAVCTHIGKDEKALQAYLQVVALNPDHAGGQEGAGLAYMNLKAGNQARPYLVAAVTLDPRRWRAHNALGILADRREEYSAAIVHYETALEINPASPMIMNNLGYSRYLSGDLDQSARDFYQATQLDAGYTPAWSNLGLVYARQGWYTDAVNILSRATDKSTASNNVGYIALQNGDLADAEQLLSEAARLSPTYYQSAHQNLELVRARMRSEGMSSGISPETLGATRIGFAAGPSRKDVRAMNAPGLNVGGAGSVDAE